MMHPKTKYIEIDYHFVREQMAIQRLDVRYVFPEDQVVDVLTKPLINNKFQLCKPYNQLVN